MSNKKSHFKTNIIYGVITLIPITLIALIVFKVIDILNVIGNKLDITSELSVLLVAILSLVIVLLITYLIGRLVRTRLGAWSFDKFEQKVLKVLPGYNIVSGILKGFTDTKEKTYEPALIRLFDQGVAVIGFVMERNDNGSITVFVPSTPVITMGNIYIVEADRVSLIEGSHLDAINCVTDWGQGTNALFNSQKTP